MFNCVWTWVFHTILSYMSQNFSSHTKKTVELEYIGLCFSYSIPNVLIFNHLLISLQLEFKILSTLLIVHTLFPLSIAVDIISYIKKKSIKFSIKFFPLTSMGTHALLLLSFLLFFIPSLLITLFIPDWRVISLLWLRFTSHFLWLLK